MAHTLTLTPQFQSNYQIGEDFGFRIIITATIPEGSDISDANVFRYVQKPARPDGTIESVFSGVCSWPDYVEMPIAAPESDTLPANFRLATIDLVVDSESVANEVWLLIQTQVQQLLQTIVDGQALTTGTPVTVSAT